EADVGAAALDDRCAAELQEVDRVERELGGRVDVEALLVGPGAVGDDYVPLAGQLWHQELPSSMWVWIPPMVAGCPSIVQSSPVPSPPTRSRGSQASSSRHQVLCGVGLARSR